MINLARVKECLWLTDNQYNEQITKQIPMVINDVRRILNHQFRERVYCVFTSGATEISSLWNMPSPDSYRYVELNRRNLDHRIEIGRVLEGTGIVLGTYITEYDEVLGVATISNATTAAGDYVYTSIDYGMQNTIAKMIWYRVKKMNSNADWDRVASESMGPVRITYSLNTNSKWGYPDELVRDLGTPYQRI